MTDGGSTERTGLGAEMAGVALPGRTMLRRLGRGRTVEDVEEEDEGEEEDEDEEEEEEADIERADRESLDERKLVPDSEEEDDGFEYDEFY